MQKQAAPSVASGAVKPIHPGSAEASAMIDSVLSEYNWPSNPKNAARAGFVAAQRLAAPGAAIAAREQAGDAWQPIETAKKHGDPVWLFDPALIDADANPTGTVDGHWQDDEGWKGAVWSMHFEEWRIETINPTHWMARSMPVSALASRQEAPAASAVPEGCTPADARMLRTANHGLAAENDQLREALEEARNGLLWYQDRYPQAVDGADDEAMARINKALKK